MTRVSSDERTWAGVEVRPDPPPPLSDQEIAEFAVELGRFANADEVETVRETGERIVKRMYCGSIELYQAYNDGDLSLDKLVAALNSNGFAGWSRSRVDRSVEVYGLGVKVGGFGQFDNISVTHLYLVIGLPADQQKQLLTDANNHAWSPSEFEEKLRPLRNDKKRKDGKDLSLIRQALSRVKRIERALHGHDEWIPDVAAAGLNPETLKQLDEAMNVCAKLAETASLDLARLLPPAKKKSKLARGKSATA